MTREHSLLGQVFFGGNPSRAEREERVLRYIIHRISEGVALPEVLEEPYVRRNCSESEVNELESGPELIRAARERLEQAFGSEELDPRHPSKAGRSSWARRR
jgi:hypothetical protein